jgi:anoctamin-10/anoctamin-7
MRAEYHGERVRDPRSGKMTKIFPAIWKIIRALISQVVVWSLICLVLAAVVSIFFLRKTLNAAGLGQGGNLIAAVVQAVQIQVLNYVYGLVSEKLNDYENHRTASDFEDSLIIKSFLFKFINSYNSLFYIAFFKQYDDTGCPDGDHCLTELQVQLGILFGTALVVNNTLEIVIPSIKTLVAERQNRAAPAAGATGADGQPAPPADDKRSQWEKEFELLPYTTFEDFDEMVVQYGYVTLFVVAFPLAPLAALINNYVEIRLDAKKILTLSQRPKPLGAVGIGTWFSILNVLSFISVITNTIIVTFNTRIVNNWANDSLYTLAWVFFVIEHCIGIIKMIISFAVPDIPEHIKEHI